jgi:hypothetical protein
MIRQGVCVGEQGANSILGFVNGMWNFDVKSITLGDITGILFEGGFRSVVFPLV